MSKQFPALTQLEYDRHGQYCLKLIQRRFGTWNHAKHLAGVRINRNTHDESALSGKRNRKKETIGRDEMGLENVMPKLRFCMNCDRAFHHVINRRCGYCHYLEDARPCVEGWEDW